MKDNSVAAIRSVPAERDPYSGRHIVTLWMTDRNALCDEVDRLRAAIAAIPRHAPGGAPRGAWLGQWTGVCGNCRIAWPCPTEQAHRLIDKEADHGRVR